MLNENEISNENNAVDENSGRESKNEKKVKITVNEKPVTVEGKKQTGLSIKQTAINQGVNIQLDFVLSIERGSGKTELIGDNEQIKVHKDDRFLAIPNDDNS